jgi:hypothetical protein
MEKQLEKFNPTKSELSILVKKYSGIEIKGIEDEKGYEIAVDAKKDLVKSRTSITNFGKKQRDEAIKWQKEVLRQEKELVEMIKPLENEIKEKIQNIDDEKEAEKRKVLLPIRIEKLEAIGIKLLDGEILRMDETEFATYFNEEKEKFLAEKERKIEEDKLTVERENKRQAELEEARKLAEENAKLDFEKKLKEQKEEQERISRENEQRKIREEEARKLAEIEEKQKIEKDKKYQDFLKKCGYNDQEFKIERIGSKVICYKKVGEIII